MRSREEEKIYILGPTQSRTSPDALEYTNILFGVEFRG